MYKQLTPQSPVDGIGFLFDLIQQISQDNLIIQTKHHHSSLDLDLLLLLFVFSGSHFSLPG